MPVLRVNSASGLVEGALRGLALLNCGRTCTAEGEQVVSTKAVRTHCHSVPKSGSDTTRGRPTTMAAPAATVTTATIASVLDLCPINVTLSFAFSDVDCSACKEASSSTSSPLQTRRDGASFYCPLRTPVMMFAPTTAGSAPWCLRQDRPADSGLPGRLALLRC